MESAIDSAKHIKPSLARVMTSPKHTEPACAVLLLDETNIHLEVKTLKFLSTGVIRYCHMSKVCAISKEGKNRWHSGHLDRIFNDAHLLRGLGAEFRIHVVFSQHGVYVIS